MRIVVGEDQLLTREGIVAVLRRSGVEVVGEAGDVAAILGLVGREQPDGVIIDVRMPPTHTDEGLQATARIRNTLAQLTLREREVLALLAEGLSNRAVGKRLFISDRTVEVHVGRVFAKLGLPDDDLANRRVLAALSYLRHST